MCVKADKFDRAASFFEKAESLWSKFEKEQQEAATNESYTKLPRLAYSHLHFNYGSYFMNFKKAEAAADHYFTGLETSPFRFCA